MVLSLGLMLRQAAPARAGDHHALIYSRDGVALAGYDTVAYFTVGKAIRGRPEFAVMWRGAIWRFTSGRNLQAFEANPWAYAPQFGGYCAYGMARGHATGTDPLAWHIVDDRLYLIHTPDLLSIWMRAPEDFIHRANANWPSALRR